MLQIFECNENSHPERPFTTLWSPQMVLIGMVGHPRKALIQVWELICSNYSDLTRPHPKWWFSKGNPFISGKSRLVKYYNLARLINLICTDNSNDKLCVFTMAMFNHPTSPHQTLTLFTCSNDAFQSLKYLFFSDLHFQVKPSETSGV